MIVKNLVPWSGHRFSYTAGDLIDVPDDVAQARIEAGLAAPHDGEGNAPVVLKRQDDAPPAAPAKPTKEKK